MFSIQDDARAAWHSPNSFCKRAMADLVPFSLSPIAATVTPKFSKHFSRLPFSSVKSSEFVHHNFTFFALLQSELLCCQFSAQYFAGVSS
jgi:hypothetical protein